MDEKLVYAGCDEKGIVLVKLSSGRQIVIGKGQDGYAISNYSDTCVVYICPNGNLKMRSANSHWDIEENA